MVVTFVSHEECNARFDGAMKAVHKLMDRLAILKSDRDEWKEQHENLLAMYRAQGAELAKEKGGWNAFYKLRKSVGEDCYPGLTAEVTPAQRRDGHG